IRLTAAVVQLGQLADDGDEVVVRQGADVHVRAQPEPAIQLEPADLGQVEPPRVEKQRSHQSAGVVHGRRVARSNLLVHLDQGVVDRKSTRLNSSHLVISYAVFCLKKKKQKGTYPR